MGRLGWLVVLVLALALQGQVAAPGGPAAAGHEPAHPYIVSFDASSDGRSLADLARVASVVHVYSVIDAALVVAPAASVPAIEALPFVWRVDPDERLSPHLDSSRPAIGVDAAVWQAGRQGAGVTVAVVDTGIDASHPGLRNNVRQGVVFTSPRASPVTLPLSTDTDGHGTHVAGIVAGTGAVSQTALLGDEPYAGVGPQTGLVALDISASFTTSTAIRAFDWVHENHAAYGIRVVQNSWGREEVGRPFDPNDPAVRASSALVHHDDLVLVFSAANQGPDGATLSIEAMNPDVLTVGAVDDAGRVATFSSRGPALFANGSATPWLKPDVVAPGVRITSTAALADPTTSLYRELSGTSQAAPHVAGVAALVLAANPALGPFDVMEVLRRSARDLGRTGPDVDTGHGLVDAAAAVALAEGAEPGSFAGEAHETYAAEGLLVTSGVADTGGLPPHTGVSVGEASGTVPVKPGARSLVFNATWGPAVAGLPAAPLALHVSDPLGALAAQERGEAGASVRFDGPRAGVWTWALVTEAAEPAVSAYALEARVDAPRPFATAGAEDFFDEGTLEALFSDARRADPFGLGGWTFLALAFLALVLLVGIVREARRP